MTDEAAPAADPTPPPTARIEIRAGGHEVVVEACAALNTVADKALHLWTATEDRTARGGDVIGFTATDPVISPLMPPEVALPHHVTYE